MRRLLQSAFAALGMLCASHGEMVYVRVPLPPGEVHPVSSLMDYQDRSIALIELSQTLERSIRRANAGDVLIDQPALGQDKLVITVFGPSADKISSLIVRTLRARSWHGRVYLTKRKHSGLSSSYVLKPHRAPKLLR